MRPHESNLSLDMLKNNFFFICNINFNIKIVLFLFSHLLFIKIKHYNIDSTTDC